MRDGFTGYFSPTEDNFAELWDHGEIVVDANVLLHLFRYPASLRDQLLMILRKRKEHLWLPHQIAAEFHRGRWKVVGDQEAKFDAVDKAVDAAKDQVVQAISGLHRLRAAESEALEGEFAKALSSFESALTKHRTDWGSHEDTFSAVVELFDGRVGPPYNKEQLEVALREGKERFDKKIPPGYEDQGKGQDEFRYGDYLLWKQLLEHARVSGKAAIFVTDDGKEDWWVHSSGKRRIPRPELVEEYDAASGGKRVHIYSVKQFLQFAASRGEQVSDEAAQEAKRAQELTEREAARQALEQSVSAHRVHAATAQSNQTGASDYFAGDAISAMNRVIAEIDPARLEAIRRTMSEQRNVYAARAADIARQIDTARAADLAHAQSDAFRHAVAQVLAQSKRADGRRLHDVAEVQIDIDEESPSASDKRQREKD